MSTEDTQVYVTGFLYQSDAYPSDPMTLFGVVDNTLRTIQGLDYWELLINRSECRFSNSTTREQLLIFLKDATYNSVAFLSDTDSTSLRTAIKDALDSVADFTYTDVEIRTSKTI